MRANRAELDLLGHAPEDDVGRKITEFHADDEVIGENLRKLQAGETLHGHEARLRHKDGSIRHVRIHSNVFRRGDDFIQTRCFTQNVTDRRLAEERLMDSEPWFTRFMQDLPGLGAGRRAVRRAEHDDGNKDIEPRFVAPDYPGLIVYARWPYRVRIATRSCNKISLAVNLRPRMTSEWAMRDSNPRHPACKAVRLSKKPLFSRDIRLQSG